MSLKYATPNQTANVDAFGNTVKTPDLVRDNRSSAASPNTSTVSQQSQTTKGNANLDGNSNRVTNDPVSNPNGKNNTNRVGNGGNSVGNRPYTPRPVNNPSTTAPNSTPSNSASPVSSPASSVSGLGAFFKLPVVRALGAVGVVLGLAATVVDVGESVAAVESGVTGQADRNKAAKQALDNATKRLEKAQLDKQKANPVNSKGSDPLSGTTDIYPPMAFSSLGKADGWYRAYTTQGNPNGFTLKEDAGNGGTNPNTAYSWQYASPPPTSVIKLTTNGITGGDEGADGSNIFTLNWFYVSNGFTAKQQPEPIVRDRYEPPLDKPKDKGDLADPNNPHSPLFFPWLPTLPVNQSDALQPNLLPNPAMDNKPFKEAEKPVFEPVVPLPSPIPDNPIANTSPAFATPDSASPNSGSTASASSSSPVTGTSANSQPVTTTPVRSDVSPSQSSNPLTQPLNPPIKAPVAPTTPNTPSSPDIGTIATVLGAIGLAISAIGQKTTKIDGQTTPQAQQTNAQQGVCNAFQPNQCGYEGAKQAATEATNPIKDIANENKGMLGALGVNLASILAAIVANFTKLFTFLDINAKVEAFKSTITLALTIHNAMMLSTNLTTTLGAIIDNVLGTFGQTFKSTDGATVTASEFLNATVKNWIIGVIGVDNYTNLTDAFATANRIYQAGINVLSTVQSMLDSANTVVQMTGINVAKIGNAIRDDGVVNPKSYAHMDDTKAGNRPSTLGRFEQLTTTISDFDSKAQNLVTVTAVPTQIKDAVKQSKDDIKAFNDARDVNSTANVEAKAAKLDQIKALKAITEATISKKDDDT